jgi:ATP-dependent Clp protease ATP-binding subunit ClpA
MRFGLLGGGARELVDTAVTVAHDLGAQTVEAEHLLLAAAQRRDTVAQVLHDEGLDYPGVMRALAAETERSLASVGVTGDAPYFSPFPGRPRFGTSAKVALERALKVALSTGDKDIGTRTMIVGILRAQLGTVPRALECAGVDRIALMTRLEGLKVG